MKIIRGEYIPQLADKVLYYYDKLYCNPNSIKDGEIIYCDTHHILKYKDILNTKKNLIIITHNSDHCLYDEFTNNLNSINVNELTCWKKWFGQNSYSKKVVPLPIGFENKRWESCFGPKTYWLNEIKNKEIIPSSLVYLNCNKNTNIAERDRCYFICSKMNGIVNLDAPELTYQQYLHRIKEHMFVLSPRGNGLDCHRTWEILMMRRVPILKREGELERLYQNLPVLFVDDWNDLYNLDLKQIYKQYSFYNQEYLNFNYWSNIN